MNFLRYDSRFGAGFCEYELFISYNGYFKPQKKKRGVFGTIYEEGILTMDNQICRGVVKTKANGEKRIQKLMPLMEGVRQNDETEDAKLARHMLNKIKKDRERFPVFTKNVLRCTLYRIIYAIICLAYIFLFFNMLRLQIQSKAFMAGLLLLGIMIMAASVMIRKISPL
ncbi:MAG: hypothetical protein IJN92_10135 [Lachnospiraceae bacterium]|nr:hypothetical protein [Lachnospiraceae bacterium]